jgi:hypothetical protein
MTNVLNSNVTSTSSFASAPIQTQDFGTPMYLAAPGSLGVGFTEVIRFYADPQEVAVDLASGDITATVAAALNAGLSQTSPRVAQVACGQIPGAVSKVTEVTVAGVVTDADAFTVTIDPGGEDFAMTYAASVPTDDAAAVIAGLIASAATTVPARYLVEVGSSTDKLTITDLLKGADVSVTAGVVGVATIAAATTTEPSGAAEGQDVEVLTAGAEDDIWTLALDGISVAYTEGAAATQGDIADGLVALVDALDNYSAFRSDITAPGGAKFIITPNYGAVSINALTLASDGAGTNTITEAQAATPIGPLMDVLFLADSTWYAFDTEVKTQGIIMDLAAWSEVNQRLFVTFTTETGALTADAASTGALLAPLNYVYTSINYHKTLTEELTFGLQAKNLGTDPDTATTTWADKTIVGMTADSTITTTQRTALESLGVGFYAGFYGVAVYWEGKNVAGWFLDQVISKDWMNARIEESIAKLLIDESNRGRKIPMSDAGIQQLAGLVRSFLDGKAVDTGHTIVVLDDDGNQVAPIVTAPRFRDVSQSDRDNRLVRLSYEAYFANAVHKVYITGYLT